jgi:hypothetical protein
MTKGPLRGRVILLVLVAALFVLILGPVYPAGTQEWATGIIGLIVGRYLPGGRAT